MKVGVISYSNGDTYEGGLKEDKKDGKGVYTSPNGQLYDGDWKEDKKSGQGTFTL